jgi:hypothetical protein
MKEFFFICKMHIHPPHKSSSNLKEHFIHFFMLFMAVLLGALAENFREKYIEKNKEKEYLSSLIFDLSQDTTRLNICINSRIEKNTNSKKLISLLSEPTITNTKDVYYLTRIMTRVETFEGVDGTLNQLQFSGGFRVIENQKIIKLINDYLYLRKNVYIFNQIEENLLLQLRNSTSKVVNAEIFSLMLDPVKNKDYKYFIKPLDKNESLFSYDKSNLNNLIYWVSSEDGNISLNINQMELLKTKGKELIKLIKSESK